MKERSSFVILENEHKNKSWKYDVEEGWSDDWIEKMEDYGNHVLSHIH